jgi:hypothetical protein
MHDFFRFRYPCPYPCPYYCSCYSNLNPSAVLYMYGPVRDPSDSGFSAPDRNPDRLVARVPPECLCCLRCDILDVWARTGFSLVLDAHLSGIRLWFV